MSNSRLIEEYTNAGGDTLELGHDDGGYWVRCWNSDDELHWEMRGVVVEATATTQKVRQYTSEAEARAEFERWR